MPITIEDDYVIKAKNAQGVYRIVGNVSYGDYGPRVSLVNCPILREALSKVEDGRRIYLPVYTMDKDADKQPKQEEKE